MVSRPTPCRGKIYSFYYTLYQYLQFGGGSNVISANSFWILFADVERAFDPNAFELLLDPLDRSRSEAAVVDELEEDILETKDASKRWVKNHSWSQANYDGSVCKPLIFTSWPKCPVKFLGRKTREIVP